MVSERVFDLAHIRDAGVASWPDVAVEPARLTATLARMVDAQPAFPADVFLAAACLARDPRALHHFDAHVLAPAVVAARIAPAERDEITQRLRVRLLADPGAKLERYRGRAPLVGWLRVVALREAIDLARSRPPSWTTLGRVARVAETLDPELALFRSRHGDAFRDALRAAVDELSAEHRAALRLYLVHDLNLEGIARALHVSRATAGRWLVAARTRILEVTRTRLGSALALTDSQVESAIRGLRSVDLDVTALL